MGQELRWRHHVVPAGYQRGFADGERIRLVVKDGSLDKLVGTKDAFVKGGILTGHFVGLPIDAAEREFARIEDEIVPVVRSISSLQLDPRQDAAVKALIALLWARSYSTRALSDQVRRQAAADRAPRLKNDPKVFAAFLEDVGRPPRPGELEAHVDQRIECFERENGFYVEKVAEYFIRAVEHFDPLTVSVYSADKVPHGFITSDNPVVLAADEQLRNVGGATMIPLLNARIIYAPLNRRWAACLTNRNESARLAAVDVVKLNNTMWRNALQFIATHPDENWRAATGLPPPRAPDG